MSSTESGSTAEPEERTRPPVRLVPAGIVVAAIVVFGLVLILLNVFYDTDVSYDSDTDTVPTTREQAPRVVTAEAAETTDTPGDVSVCGLEPVQMDGTVASAPAVAIRCS